MPIIAAHFSQYVASVQMENQICSSTSSYRTHLCGGNVFAGRETEEPLSEQHLPLQISTVSRRPSRAGRAASTPPRPPRRSSRCWAHSSPPPPRSATGIDLKIFATREDVTFVSGAPFPPLALFLVSISAKRNHMSEPINGAPP